MKYRVILQVLKLLIYGKRLVWWLGGKTAAAGRAAFAPLWCFIGLAHYKTGYLLHKITGTLFHQWLFRRDNLQAAILLILLIAAIPQTRLYAFRAKALPGQKTIAYALTRTDEDYVIEEITAIDDPEGYDELAAPSWREGVVTPEQFMGVGLTHEQELAGIVAGGGALTKPFIFPGAAVGGARDKVIEYEVQPGDSLGSIAARFGVSVATIIWENTLSLRSYIHPGDKLRILPLNGLSHTIKRGDNVKKIAALYEAKTEDIITFNKLKEDGSDLVVGEKIIVPNGIKPAERAVAVIPRTDVSVTRRSVPPPSRQIPSVSGFIWPTAARAITQYYSWRHHALDIAGPLNTPTYAAKAGVVEKSQCGWNSGYGCYIIIDHGGGVKTLYGHHNKLLVSPGESVVAGQTIGLMGNTGKVRGRTGIHVHFEVVVNGVRINPLGYVRVK